MKRAWLSSAATVLAVVALVLTAGAVMAAGLDGTAALSTLGSDLASTVSTNLAAILTVGFIVIGAFAGLSFLFRMGNKAGKGRG